MAYAAATFVYNESVNLPIWVNYYGKLFGHKNLFVIDRSSTDGSTGGLGDVNVIKIPRDEFDEDAKTKLMSSFHTSLTAIYEAVIITDCDEIIVPDPDSYTDLCDYISKMEGDYINAIGIDIVHMITDEPPLDLSHPILSQRKVGRFHAPECKHLLSKIPIRWLPGLHSSNKPPKFDPRLINFHLKMMDYNSAMARQAINLATKWSKASLEYNYGAHHRYNLRHFVTEGFLVPIDLINRDQLCSFEFGSEIEEMMARTVVDVDGYHRVPMDLQKMVSIPDRFKSIF